MREEFEEERRDEEEEERLLKVPIEDFEGLH